MKIINYGRQTIDNSDIKSVVKTLKSNYLTQGPKVLEFEKAINKKFGSRYSVAVSNGTAALFIATRALGWKKKDVIITTPITFLATANCIENLGAKTDFVDINEKDFTIDPKKLEKKLKKNKKIKGVIAVDYAGHPSDWKSLRKLADKYKFTLINDNCHAIGAKYNNNLKYAIKYADIVTHSYHPVKTITTGEGGAILCKDKKIYEKIVRPRSHSIIRNKSNIKPWHYDVHEVGFNYRMSDIQCALGLSQLKKLSQFVKKRRLIANYYKKLLKDDKRFILPSENKNIFHSYHLFPLQIDFNKTKINKSILFKEMKKRGINLQVHYIPIYRQPFYRKKYNFKKEKFKNSERFFKRVLSLPIYPSLTFKDANKVIKTITKLI
jgi:UDP-4-amino-4,6-dideoxy-N-acetyl-beta-L-altrosamine transaminase